MLKEKILNVLHISPFAYSDPSRGWLIFVEEWMFVCSEALKKSTPILLRATEDSSPVGTIWIRKEPTSVLVRICFSLLLLSCWWHRNHSWFLFCLQEVNERRISESISYARWGDPLHHTNNLGNSPFSSPKASCPSNMLLTAPFQREWLLPAELPSAAAL